MLPKIYLNEEERSLSSSKRKIEISQLNQSNLGSMVIENEFDVVCMVCDTFIGHLSNLKFNNGHIIVPPDFQQFLVIKPHPGKKKWQNLKSL